MTTQEYEFRCIACGKLSINETCGPACDAKVSEMMEKAEAMQTKLNWEYKPITL